MVLNDNSALIIGRFQPFHRGHLEAVRKISKRYDRIIIGLGSAQYSHTADNPFSFRERSRMIKAALDAEGIPNYTIVPIDDLHKHSEWVAHVVSLVPPFSEVFTNEPLTRRLFAESGKNVKRIPFLNRKEYCGTEVRKRMREGADWDELVPDAVADIIRRIEGVERVKNI